MSEVISKQEIEDVAQQISAQSPFIHAAEVDAHNKKVERELSENPDSKKIDLGPWAGVFSPGCA